MFFGVLFFARPLHSTSQFDKMFLSKCVCHTSDVFLPSSDPPMVLFLFEAVLNCATGFLFGRHLHASKASHMSFGVD